MRCKRCGCYPEHGGQYGGLNSDNLCSYCEEKVKKVILHIEYKGKEQPSLFDEDETLKF
jgi:hypothetical protein